MKLILSIGARINAIGILNEYKGELAGVYKILKIIEKLDILEKERQEIKLITIPNRDGTFSTQWDFRKGKSKEFELTPDEFNLFKTLLENKKDYPVNRFVIELAKQFDIIQEEEKK